VLGGGGKKRNGDIEREICLYLQGEEMQLLDNRPILRFQAHTRQLAGLYQCIAINGVGSPATATIQLRILCEYSFKKVYGN
jgi:hypothetical protein